MLKLNKDLLKLDEVVGSLWKDYKEKRNELQTAEKASSQKSTRRSDLLGGKAVPALKKSMIKLIEEINCSLFREHEEIGYPYLKSMNSIVNL
jgi:hypothetical protein